MSGGNLPCNIIDRSQTEYELVSLNGGMPHDKGFYYGSQIIF